MSRNHVKITKRANTPKTARVVQVSGIFDLPLEAKQTREWDHYLPIEEKTWQVGLIVGPSGAGKSVLANELWPGKVREGYEWDERSIVDNFDNSLDINQITGALTAVGLATYNDETLLDILQDLPDLTGTGYTDNDLADLIASMTGEELEPEDDPTPNPYEDFITIRMQLPPHLAQQWLALSNGFDSPEEALEYLLDNRVSEH
ncbi:hypothetical protein [Corynebacterium diphtheriae]|uniref:hypothetical protein n=1 Tax=Corynebacterium diphtheriae TaxID=1717 RepID=UPI001FD3A15A|nr:hypothetical protein [Corynebacterium diphtheriae]